MPTYILLDRFTEKGISAIKQAPSRIDAHRRNFKAAGAELKAVYLTMGRYDGVMIVEAPDDETIARLCLQIGAAGNVRTETLRAFDEERLRKLVGSLP